MIVTRNMRGYCCELREAWAAMLGLLYHGTWLDGPSQYNSSGTSKQVSAYIQTIGKASNYLTEKKYQLLIDVHVNVLEHKLDLARSERTRRICYNVDMNYVRILLFNEIN